MYMVENPDYMGLLPFIIASGSPSWDGVRADGRNFLGLMTKILKSAGNVSGDGYCP